MQIRRHLSYANVMSTVAVIVAVAGGSTAIAVTVSASKKSDINKKGNIRAGRVTTKKLADGGLTAAKLAGIDLVQVTGQAATRATCPAGERLVGGGARIDPGPTQAALVSSNPDGNTWVAGVNNGAGSPPITVTALCLK